LQQLEKCRLQRTTDSHPPAASTAFSTALSSAAHLETLLSHAVCTDVFWISSHATVKTVVELECNFDRTLTAIRSASTDSDRTALALQRNQIRQDLVSACDQAIAHWSGENALTAWADEWSLLASQLLTCLAQSSSVPPAVTSETALLAGRRALAEYQQWWSGYSSADAQLQDRTEAAAVAVSTLLQAGAGMFAVRAGIDGATSQLYAQLHPQLRELYACLQSEESRTGVADLEAAIPSGKLLEAAAALAEVFSQASEDALSVDRNLRATAQRVETLREWLTLTPNIDELETAREDCLDARDVLAAAVTSFESAEKRAAGASPVRRQESHSRLETLRADVTTKRQAFVERAQHCDTLLLRLASLCADQFPELLAADESLRLAGSSDGLVVGNTCLAEFGALTVSVAYLFLTEINPHLASPLGNRRYRSPRDLQSRVSWPNVCPQGVPHRF